MEVVYSEIVRSGTASSSTSLARYEVRYSFNDQGVERVSAEIYPPGDSVHPELLGTMEYYDGRFSQYGVKFEDKTKYMAEFDQIYQDVLKKRSEILSLEEK